MPLVEHSRLPAFERLRNEGIRLVSSEEAAGSTLPELHIAVLNLMPDTALRATDAQFARLVASFGEKADLWLHVFTMGAASRGAAAHDHIAKHYESLDSIRERPVDALIITGANPSYDDMTREEFWPGMFEVFSWADRAVISKMCSCFATHAIFKLYWGVERVRLPAKMWGVYSHQPSGDHPLLRGVDFPVDAPHSHYFDLSREQMESVGASVLIESPDAGVHMAVHDEYGFVFFQGHPEYDENSLLKEYKREVWRYLTGQRSTFPRLPDNYFTDEALAILDDYRTRVVELDDLESVRDFPEDRIREGLVNTWSGVGRVIYRNWLEGVLAEKVK